MKDRTGGMKYASNQSATRPGDLLGEELVERVWTVDKFAQILGMLARPVPEIMNDRKEITTETPLAIGKVLGTSAELWLNLQFACKEL